MPAPDHAAFWNLPLPQTLIDLKTSVQGLDPDEAALRLADHGPNVAVRSVHRSLLVKFVKRLFEPLIAILFIAAAVSGATGDWQSFVIIVSMVVLSITLDLVQEHKAEAAVEALKQTVAVKTRVRRGGQELDLPVHDVVPGDIVLLESGDLIPADGLVISARDLTVNEALLTGEPYPADKVPGATAGDNPAEANGAVFSGTSVSAGSGEMLVVNTGAQTRFGAIATSLEVESAPTAFERGVHGLGLLIMRLTAFLVLFVLLTQMIGRGLTMESFLFAVALAVGLTPELLPMVMTVTLSRGAVRMAKKQVVVKRLSAIHDLGAMDVLCTDKTGTLTEARIALVECFGNQGTADEAAMRLAVLNSGLVGGLRSNLDEAILSGHPVPEGATRRDTLPFDFNRRLASVLVEEKGALTLVTKGAPETVLEHSTQFLAPDGSSQPLDEANRARIKGLMEERETKGFRLLGLAFKPMASAPAELAPEDESALVFAGCAVFLDPPKASAGEAVKALRQAGVHVKIISGDAAPVVKHLVESLGIPARGCLSGDEITDMSDAALALAASHTDLFVRISPDQKRRIVAALRAAGHTVGFIGDGINDAPAIHAADVGLSVEGGTDVAREAADIILLAPDLNVLAEGVREGRRTYANIMKYVRMGTSSNFGNMLSMAFASLFLPFLPLTPLQVLLNNLLYDISEIGIPFDEADKDDLDRPRVWDMRAVLRFTLVMGPLSSLFDLATFLMLGLYFDAPVNEFRTAWFTESILTQILVIFIIRTAKPFWQSRAHWALIATSLGCAAIGLVIALTPAGALFGFVPLPLPVLAAIGGLTLLYLALAEGLKRFALKPGRRRLPIHPAHIV